MMPSISSQLAAMTGYVAKPHANPSVKKTFNEETVEIVFEQVTDKPIGSGAIAEATGLHLRTVQIILSDLVKDNRVRVKRIRQRAPSMYYLPI